MTPDAVISECLKFHGWGERFPRTDGLERDRARRLRRGEYLAANPGLSPEHREAILRAEVTPGMRKQQVVVAWSLAPEETRDVYGHVADVAGASYAYFTGFEVGRRHALCLVGNLVVGVRLCDEVLIRRDRGLEMEVARHYLGYVEFFETDEGEAGGRTTRLADRDFEIWEYDAPVQGIVLPYSTDPAAAERLEWEVRGRGLFDEYLRALAGLGTDFEAATPAERCRAAVEVARRHGPPEGG